jgi:hypothetical protein
MASRLKIIYNFSEKREKYIFVLNKTTTINRLLIEIMIGELRERKKIDISELLTLPFPS